MRSKLRAARALSWRDWWVLWHAWVLLLAVDLGLRVWPLRRVQTMLAIGRRRGTQGLAVHDVAAIVARLAWLVRVAASNHLYPMRCLPRSLVLQWLLARHGVEADLRIGVQRDKTALAGHAWLEHQGSPIGEPEGIEGQFAPLVAPEGGR